MKREARLQNPNAARGFTVLQKMHNPASSALRKTTCHQHRQLWGFARCCKKGAKGKPEGRCWHGTALACFLHTPRSTPKPYWHQIPFPHRHQPCCCSFVKLEAEKQDPFLDPCGRCQAERHQGSDRGPPPPASISPKGMGRAGRSQPCTSLLHTSGTIPRPVGSGAVTKPQFSPPQPQMTPARITESPGLERTSMIESHAQATSFC